MRYALLLLLLLWPSSAWAQSPVIVGEEITPEKLAEIEKRHHDDEAYIEAARTRKKLDLAVGEFEVFWPGKAVKGPVTWLAINSNLIRKIDVKAGQEFTFYGRRKGQTVDELHEFKAETFGWWVLIGKKEGASPLVLVQNGADPTKNPPKVIDQIDATVGRPVPPVPPVPPGPPVPPPSNDALVVAARADVAAGKGTAEDVAFYREYFRAAVAGLPNYKTNFEFLDAFDDGIENRLGVAKDANAKLPMMRRAVADALNASGLPRNQITFDAASRARFAEEFTKIADRLKGY